MAHIFEKHNFKNYLHRNCKRDWFTYTGEYVVKYEDQNGVHPANTSKRTTLVVPWAIKDPILNKTGARAVEAYSQIQTATAVVAGLAVPFTGGASLAVAAASGGAAFAWGKAAKVASEKANEPEDVYFITSDNSEWVAKNVPVNGAWQVANNACVWGNQVFRERYVDQKSSQFQTYIQQRPPTPGAWPPSDSW